MIVWSAICVYTDANDVPQLCFNEVFDNREQAMKCIMDSFYLEYEDFNGNYIDSTPDEKTTRNQLTDFGVLMYKDGHRKFRWFLRSNRT